MREAAERLGCGKDTAAKWFQELEDKGFLKARQRGSFTYKARHASEWEITAEPYRDKPASKGFMRWNPANKIQSTVLTRGTDSPTERDRATLDRPQNTRHGPNQKDRHPQNGPPHGPTEKDTSNIPGGVVRRTSSDEQHGASESDLLAIPECFNRRKKKNDPKTTTGNPTPAEPGLIIIPGGRL